MRYVRPRDYRLHPRQPVPELDQVEDDYRRSRLTFSEEEALAALWGAGNEIRLREDLRFWEIAELGQFHLADHRLANGCLADRLWHGLWDGQDIEAELSGLDIDEPGSCHVFCASDPVLRLREGAYTLVARSRPQVPDELRERFDAVQPRLLEEHQSVGLPKTTHDLIELLARIDDSFELTEDSVDHVEGWLDCKQEWSEIARGLWLPTSLVPATVRPRQFRVRAVGGIQGDTVEGEVFPSGVAPLAEPPSTYEPWPDPPVERDPDKSVSWTHTLQTVHIDSSYVPVPTAARFRYPRFVGRLGPLAIRAVLHETGQQGYFWLDREHNRFFGELVKSLVEWEDAGRRVHLRWGAEAVVATLGEIDAEVQAEESRHIDPDALYELRRGKGESYRHSLIEVFKANGHMPFRELYEALACRVGHRPSRHSVRKILSASPDFIVQGKDWEWREAPDADRSFRRTVVLSALGLDPSSGSIDVAELARAASQRAEEVTREIDN